MINIVEEKDCCGCEACANVCPAQCISMELRDGFYYPVVNREKCIECASCERVCPIIHHSENPKGEKIGVAGYIKNEQARFNSTSGGAAYLLGEYAIENGGFVYGVSFDDKFQTVFSSARNKEELEKLQGSKYPQSRIGNEYREIKEELRKGNKVVVVGTPCQIYGLNNFLGKTYENLILVDLICHGVPSPEVWMEYLKSLFPTEEIQKVTFKHKSEGWKKWHVHIETNKSVYSRERGNDTYMSSYLGGYNVRPSCFYCMFKNDTRVSDITIADAWGIPEKDKALNDDKGLSSLIFNTEKGKQFFELLKDKFVYKEFSVEELIQGNLAYSQCIRPNSFRGMYLMQMRKKGVLKTLNHFAMNSLNGKIYMKISNCINKLSRR